jgi:hypothetical protein
VIRSQSHRIELISHLIIVRRHLPCPTTPCPTTIPTPQKMALNGQIPNGGPVVDIPSAQTVIGINFGNSFASIAVINNVCRPLSFALTRFLIIKVSRRDSLTVSRTKMANARSPVPSLFAVKKLHVSQSLCFSPMLIFFHSISATRQNRIL